MALSAAIYYINIWFSVSTGGAGATAPDTVPAGQVPGCWRQKIYNFNLASPVDCTGGGAGETFLAASNLVRSLIDNFLKSPPDKSEDNEDDEEAAAFFLFGLHVDVKLEAPEHALGLALNIEP